MTVKVPIGTHSPCWGTSGRRVFADDEDAFTLGGAPATLKALGSSRSRGLVVGAAEPHDIGGRPPCRP